MFNLWSKNLLFLREQKEESQQEAATALGLTRSTYANYEAGCNLPNIETVRKILRHFNVSFDEFLSENIEEVRKSTKSGQKSEQQKVREDLRKHVRKDGQMIESTLESLYTFISSEYYRKSLADVFDLGTNDLFIIPGLIRDYREMYDLASIVLPGLGEGLHIRVPVEGNSMQPTIKSHEKVVATFLPEPATTLREGHIYLVLDKVDGLVCKRIYMVGEDTYQLVSDNRIYKPYKRPLKEIIAVFKVVELHTRHFSTIKDDNQQENKDE